MTAQFNAQQRRDFLKSLAALSGSLPLWAQAQSSWPTKPVTMVVPFPAGGGTDAFARPLSAQFAKLTGKQLIIDNRGGAGGTLGAGVAAKSAPDGYNLLISSNTTFTVNAALKKNLPYDPQKDFESIGLIGSSPLVLLAHPKVPANNVKELLALAKADPKGLNFGSFGVGTSAHLAGEMFKVMTGAHMVHVAYRGSAPAMTDLIGGQIPLSFDTSVAAMPQMATGKVKAIAVTTRQRSPQMPQVPTVAEAGFPDYEMVPWIGLVARRGMPAEVSGKLAQALKDSVNDPVVKAELQKVGLDVLFQPGSVYDAKVAQELPLLRAYVHRANIPVE